MAAKPSTTPAPTAESFEAFANFLRTNTDASAVGADGNFTDWFKGDGGQAAIAAHVAKQDADLRGLRMSWARAVAKDFKVNGRLTSYSGGRALALRDYLATVDFDALADPATETTDDATDTDN